MNIARKSPSSTINSTSRGGHLKLTSAEETKKLYNNCSDPGTGNLLSYESLEEGMRHAQACPFGIMTSFEHIYQPLDLRREPGKPKNVCGPKLPNEAADTSSFDPINL